MSHKIYTSFEEIELDLKLLSLENKINIEELKSLKYKFQDELSNYSWLKTGLQLFGNFGGLLMLRKLFK
jgi:hypothetical protein